MTEYAYDYELIRSPHQGWLVSAIKTNEDGESCKRVFGRDELMEYFGKSEWIDREDQYVGVREWAAEYMNQKRAAQLWEAE